MQHKETLIIGCVYTNLFYQKIKEAHTFRFKINLLESEIKRMIKFDNSGFKELERKLKQMEQSAKEIDGTNSVPFDELFSDGFMQKFTTFTSIETMFNESPFTIETAEDFASIDDNEWDEYVRNVTNFDSWEQMQEKAAIEWTAKKLGF